MHTGFVPNPNVEHPGYGSVIAHELAGTIDHLKSHPSYQLVVAALALAFLVHAWAPFVVSPQGDVKNLESPVSEERLAKSASDACVPLRIDLFGKDEASYQKITEKLSVSQSSLMSSSQLAAFKVSEEPASVRERYGETNFGRGLFDGSPVGEVGVPFVEVNLGGWDNHNNIFFDACPTKNYQILIEG
jgi:hypothetical protein